MSSFTLVDAVSVMVSMGPPGASRAIFRVSDGDRHVARLGIVQRGELLDSPPADLVDHALAQAAVQVADQLGVRLGELAERAMEELDAGGALVLAVGGVGCGLEAELSELVVERPGSCGCGRACRLRRPM